MEHLRREAGRDGAYIAAANGLIIADVGDDVHVGVVDGGVSSIVVACAVAVRVWTAWGVWLA